MRIEVEKEYFKKNIKQILKYFTDNMKGKYQQHLHFIVPGLERDFYPSLQLIEEFSPFIKIYNEYVTAEKCEFNTELLKATDKYIININEFIIEPSINEKYYNQQIAGYSPTDLNQNLIMVLKEDGVLYYKHNEISICSMENGDVIPVKPNLYFGLNGKCSDCCNCMCDFTESKSFIVNEEECETGIFLKSMLREEVTEITQEQFIKLAESINTLARNTQIDHAIILATLTGGNNEQNKE